MRLATLRTAARGPRACAFRQGAYVDLQDADPTLPATVRGLLALGREGLERASAALTGGATRYNPASAEFLAPVPDPGKVLCLGMNYRDHAAEIGAEPPNEPVLFAKFASSLIGPGQAIVLPPESAEVDYEAELVAVIGRGGRRIPRARAREHIAGYAIGHDVSARDWQLRKPGRQWLAGKSFDTFAPVGPDLVTADEVGDPGDLGIRLRLNGRTLQDSSTREWIFGLDEVIAYASTVATLEPGDLIFTGTPPGVGMARTPPIWLKAGDVVEVEIDGLGILRNPVVSV